ncbi:hypothetical protein VP434O481_P0015 [Vibrio phage 434O48-1]|nr:hypothetical protein VP434O481_P0015 [Vibrio phage 434O48-1]
MKKLKVIFANILHDGNCSAKIGVFLDGSEEPVETQSVKFYYSGGNVIDEALSKSTIELS